jgi:hypothetical protein
MMMSCVSPSLYTNPAAAGMSFQTIEVGDVDVCGNMTRWAKTSIVTDPSETVKLLPDWLPD